MTTIQGTLIGHPSPTSVEVTATLVDLNGTQRTGYVTSSSGEITAAQKTTPDRTGAWSFDLTPTANITSNFGDTLWRITAGTSPDYGRSVSTYITVPASGGPYWVGALRTTPPGGAGPQTYAVQSVDGLTGIVDLSSRYVPLSGSAWRPADVGCVAWTSDPLAMSGGVALTSGVVRLFKFRLRAATTVSSLKMIMSTAGATLTAGQNFAGLYDAAGNRVAVSADLTTDFGIIGEKEFPFTAPYSAAAGDYFGAIVSNGTTPPAFLVHNNLGSGTTIATFGVTLAAARYLTGPSAQTTLPTSIALGSQAASQSHYFAALKA